VGEVQGVVELIVVATGVVGLLRCLFELRGENPAERVPGLGDAYELLSGRW
jgi:hypothetical protein